MQIVAKATNSHKNHRKAIALNFLANYSDSQLSQDQKEATRLGESWEWLTRVSVVKEGNFSRSEIEEVDEAEIFEGGENKLIMIQAYTWEFQCAYKLQQYPFDTQVNIIQTCFFNVLDNCPCLRNVRS